MERRIQSHRFGWEIINNTKALKLLWEELDDAIKSITDERLKTEFLAQQGSRSGIKFNSDGDGAREAGGKMSLSAAINTLLDQELVKMGWTRQSALFQGPEYSSGTRWRLDFSKNIVLEANEEVDLGNNKAGMAVEVAFNHGEAIAWNLLKPVIAAELNHVPKETNIGAGVGIVICATEALKTAGAFDGAVGEFEKFERYLKPMRNQLTVPMLLVGLEAPQSFRVEKVRDKVTGKNSGVIVDL